MSAPLPRFNIVVTDVFLLATLGFLGSFGHCAGMCGPLAIALSGQARTAHQLVGFHLALNLGRVLSYVMVGAVMGGLSSVVVASGTLAGVGSPLRRAVTILAGSLLIWLGLVNILKLPRLPLGWFSSRLQTQLHQLLNRAAQSQGIVMGLVWGLVPCGFLYTAQIKAAASGSAAAGATAMLAFGLGTLPTMVLAGVSVRLVNPAQRQRLSTLGGWSTLIIGILTLTRTGEMPLVLSGYGSLLCLMLALVARPLSQVWPGLLQARRALGIAAFGLATVHTLHMLEHSWNWQWQAYRFMLPQSQWGIALGTVALGLMLPAALTSFDTAQRRLGANWRRLHLLTVPAAILASGHCVLTGSRFLGRPQPLWEHWLAVILLLGLTGLVLGARSQRCWRWLGLSHHYRSLPQRFPTEKPPSTL